MEKLAILGGAPVRTEPPTPRPRLTANEQHALFLAAGGADWSLPEPSGTLPCLDALEQRWAEAHGAIHAVTVSSGTAGLSLVLQALQFYPGDEVLIPAYGCPAVDVAVLGAGLTPIHVDIDPATYGINPLAAAAAVTARTAALVAVHFGGQPARIRALAQVAERNGLALIEDACLAPGAAADGKPVSAWGRASVFSFGVRKPLSAGEGGLVTTNEGALAGRVRRLRSLGADPETGEIAVPTGNFRMTELQAAVLLPQLARLEADRRRREAAAARLAEAVSPFPWLKPLAAGPDVTHHAWAQFWLRLDEAAGVTRRRFVEAVQAEGIPLFEGWPHPNYCHPMYTRERAAAWLPARESGRAADHYEQTACPLAERAAFSEALLFDFPTLDADEPVLTDTVRALRKVGEQIEALREFVS